ncbi:hypothetical protein [Brevibacterium otitidis]|uniref:Uncharacterized protein n=1 Tax=Brevibacterium otitidis TaxID=53364 RepID=A0ABV5X643_9MICO|nr:hypothetical protein GCM10023233_25070 [Brevibacterium otitidis]
MEYVKVLLPSLCVALLFWYVIRAIIRADSIERREMDRYYAELEDSEKQEEKRPDEAAAEAREKTDENQSEPAAQDADETSRH